MTVRENAHKSGTAPLTRQDACPSSAPGVVLWVRVHTGLDTGYPPANSTTTARPSVRSATGRCRVARQGPYRSSGATGLHFLGPAAVARSRAAPHRHSESDGGVAVPAGVRR